LAKMKTIFFLSITTVLVIFSLSVAAAPSLDIRSEPVQNNGYTGPSNDPAATMGQWFYNPISGVGLSKTHEFYDNPSVIGDQGVLSINGVVTGLIKAG